MFLRSFRTAVSLVLLSSALTTVNAISDVDFDAVSEAHNGYLQKQGVTSFPKHMRVQMYRKGDPIEKVAPDTVMVADAKDYFKEHNAFDTFFKANPEALFCLDLSASDLCADSRKNNFSFFSEGQSKYRALPKNVYLSNTKGDIKEIHVNAQSDIFLSILSSETLVSLTLIDFPELTKIGKGLLGHNANLSRVNFVGLPKLQRVGKVFENCQKLSTVDFSDLSDTVKFDISNGFCGAMNVENLVTSNPCGEQTLIMIRKVNAARGAIKPQLLISHGASKTGSEQAASSSEQQ